VTQRPGSRPVPRRALLGMLGTAAASASLLLSCRRSHEPPGGRDGKGGGADALPTGARLLDWSFPGAAATGGSERAVVLLPPGSGPHPVLVALHGRGEAVRGPEVGAYGWVRSYRLLAMLSALGRGRLTTADLQGLVEPGRLAALNRSLSATPYGGLVVVCPHVPDLTGKRALAATERWGKFLMETLLPRVRSEHPPARASAVGIDGVSMGGRVSMLVGLGVSGMQPAFDASEAADLVGRSRSYLAGRPAGKIRLLTSDGDYFRPAVGAIDGAMTSAGVAHDFLQVTGPHDYSFNEGPGGAEMLLWHDRVLRGLPAP
jgi:iron(III)-salmochelin esterase